MASSHVRGWPVVFKDPWWRWEDTGEPINFGVRPCARCGQPPTEEGYDACIGHLEGVSSACCGHGVTEPILMENQEE